MAAATRTAAPAKPGKYLSFVLGREEYGLEILKVREIMGIMELARVPQTPPSIRGVINLRGRRVPVVDLRARFKMPAVADTEKTCVIVVEVSQDDLAATMGVIVDEVSEVLSFTRDQIEPAPDLAGGLDKAEFVTGIGKLGRKALILLDSDRVLQGDQLASFK